MMEQIILYFLDDFLTPFRHPLFGLTGLFILMGFVFSSYLQIKIKSRAVEESLSLAINTISNINDEREFSSQHNIINVKLKSIPLLKRNWEEFNKTLIPPLLHIDEPEYEVFRATKRTWDYFDLDHVTAEIKPILKSETLIGIGLVLTFFGLVAALIHAGLYIQTNATPKEVMDAIQELLRTAGAKFFSSIGGVGGAIIQSGIIYKFEKRIQTKLYTFNDKLESLLPFASQERILADQYSQSIRQTKRLEEMGTEITLALGEKIPHAMNQIPVEMKDALTGVMGPVAEKLENMTDSLSKSSTDALGQMVKEFSLQIQGAGEQTMEQVVGQLDSLSNALNATVGTLSQSNIEMRSSLQDVMAMLAETTKKFDSSVQASADAVSTQLNSTSTTLFEGLTKVLRELQTQQSSSTTAIESLVEKLDGAASNAAESLKSNADQASVRVVEGIADAMKTVVGSLSQSSIEMRSGLQEVMVALAETTKKFDSSVQASANAASNQLNSTSTTLFDGLTKVLRELQAQQSSSTAAIESLVEKLDGAGTNAAESLKSNADQASVKVVEGIADAMRTVVGSLSQSSMEMRSGLQDVMVALAETTKKFDSSVQASADAASNQLNSTSITLMDGLANALREIQSQQSSSTAAIESLVEKLDGAAINAAQSLKSNADQAGVRVAEGITDAMRAVLVNAENATKDVSDSVKTGIAELVAALTRINFEIEKHGQNVQAVNSKLIDTSSAIGGAAEGIRASTQPLTQVTSQLSTAADSIRKSISDTYGQIESLVNATNSASENISNAIDSLSENWEDQSAQLKDADKSLEDAFKQITKNLETSLDVLSRFVNNLDGVMSKSMNSLAGIANELSEALEDSKKP